MKIRMGFVSNSSTSSFCIYGINLSCYSEEDKEIISKIESGKIDLKMLEEHFGPSDDRYYGKSWSEIGDEETGLQFKQSIEKIINAVPELKDKKCSTFEEGWYNG